MTFFQYFMEYLTDRGLFEDQAKSVIVNAHVDLEERFDRWDDPVEDYPDTMLAIVLISVNEAAIAWIDENIPQAWYRGMFL